MINIDSLLATIQNNPQNGSTQSNIGNTDFSDLLILPDQYEIPQVQILNSKNEAQILEIVPSINLIPTPIKNDVSFLDDQFIEAREFASIHVEKESIQTITTSPTTREEEGSAEVAQAEITQHDMPEHIIYEISNNNHPSMHNPEIILKEENKSFIEPINDFEEISFREEPVSSTQIYAPVAGQGQQHEQQNSKQQSENKATIAISDKMETKSEIEFQEIVKETNENIAEITEVQPESHDEIITQSSFTTRLKSDIEKIETKPIIAKSPVSIEHIHIEIEQAVKTGESEIKIVLNPEHLGSIDVKINISENGTYNFEIIAENKDTLELLQQEVKNLESQIKEVTKSEDSSFNFNLKDENQKNQKNQQEYLENKKISSEEELDTYSVNYAYGFQNRAGEDGVIDISV
jgi:flagellar hook-length control protein FliK